MPEFLHQNHIFHSSYSNLQGMRLLMSRGKGMSGGLIVFMLFGGESREV